MTSYHDMPFAVSQSFLKAWDRDPVKAYRQYVTETLPQDKPTASMQWGSLCEEYLLGDRSSLVEIPDSVLNADGHRKGTPWQQFAEAHDGKTLLTARDAAVLQEVERNCREHREAASILFDEDGETWRVLQWTDDETGLRCKAELDRISRTVGGVAVIGDLKTAAATDAGSFTRQAWSLGYGRQADWYRTGLHALTGEWLPFVFVVVKNSPCWNVEVYELDEAFLAYGEAANRASIRRYADCLARDDFRTPTHGTIVELEPPRWARYEHEYLLED